jgi:hypothetical protein
MVRRSVATALAALSFTLATSAPAQLPNLSGGADGLLGGVLPNVGSIGAGNAAGVLTYCMKNKFLGGANATSVLGRLTGKPGVKTSKGFALGRNGTVHTENSQLSLGSLKGKVKTRVCDLVLSHAGSLL